ncbi:cell wall protein DAN4 isoform X3 [Nematostella vectensis]|uniref:cell wall protein DAN4 isoform X3 n=1 Tax=Nematostella vectensis TaxID=45351 RepID=UPI0013900A3B|nr:cell wall protein DAN4 isoform X3 [Nematostella vectensis]
MGFIFVITLMLVSLSGTNGQNSSTATVSESTSAASMTSSVSLTPSPSVTSDSSMSPSATPTSSATPSSSATSSADSSMSASAPMSSAKSSTNVPSGTSSATPASATSGAFSSTVQAPANGSSVAPTTQTPKPGQVQYAAFEMRIMGIDYNPNQDCKDQIPGVVKKIEEKGKVTDLKCKNGSIIAEFTVEVNSTGNPNAAQEFLETLYKEIQSGTFGNLTVDEKHPMGAKITKTEIIGDPTAKPKPKDEASTSFEGMALVVLILLCVSIGILLFVILAACVCFLRIKRRMELKEP